MKIYLKEITDQETELDFTQDEKWVLDAVTRVDEHLDERSKLKEKLANNQQARPVSTHLALRKVDDVVVLNGEIDTYIKLVCSRCATSYHHQCHPKLSALFCNDPVMAGIAHLERAGDDKREPGKPVGQNKGFARHAHNYAEDEQVEEGSDLDITYLATDFIDLAQVLTEQLQLQVPFQPLCKEDCKGMCMNCGADLNIGKCACAKIAKNQAFTVLKNMKF